MKILIFSDVHRDLRALERVMAQPADLYICAGDLATFDKGLERCGEVLAPLGERLWMLPGNHETHDRTRDLCAKHGFVDFHRQVRKLGASDWAGLGYSNITPFKTPGEYSEEQIAEALAAFDGIEKLNLVVHFPPYNTMLDEFAPGKHAGSPTLRSWVERAKPKFLFCGHIHETAGKSEMLGATKCVNVGKQGYSIEI
ncbi:MAG: metallophosphoesterase family protein [Candidatus Acidiferrales bacterium]